MCKKTQVKEQRLLSLPEIVLDLFPRVKREFIEDKFFLEKALKNPQFEGAIVGSSSIYSSRKRTSFVFKDSNSLELPLTRTAIARRIVEQSLFLNGVKMYPYQSRKKEWTFLSPPLYCVPYSGDALYIDLKSAYYQVYSKLPLVSSKLGRKYLISPPWLFPFLPNDLNSDKLIRNAIVGVWRGNSRTVIKNGQIERTQQTFPTSCYSHWDMICEILNYFALKAVEFGATYVHTDGYIFPENTQWKKFQDLLDSWGFVWAYKARGITSVWSIGSYEVGSLSTKRVNEKYALDKVDSLTQGELILTQLKKHNPYWSQTNGLLLR